MPGPLHQAPNAMERCGAKTRSGGRCKKPAGWGTPHNGQGRCRLHGGATPIRSGRYSRVQRSRLTEAIEHYSADADPLDVRPELAAARALFQDFVERYDEWRDAFLAWHASFNTGQAEPKPRRVLDLSDAVRHLDTIAKIAQREKRLQLENAISRKDLLRVLTEMRRVVEGEVDDAAARKRIHDGWNAIHLA